MIEVRTHGFDDTSGKNRSNDDDCNSGNNTTQKTRFHSDLHFHRRSMSSALITSETAVSFPDKKIFILGMPRQFCAYAIQVTKIAALNDSSAVDGQNRDHAHGRSPWETTDFATRNLSVLNLADLRILIVDDDQFMREMTKQIVHAFGVYAIELADTGASGLELIASFSPDVVLCDIEMSPMSGIELLRRVRHHADAKLRDTAVIMLTGHAEMKVVDQARQLRANGYLVKPISPSQLNAKLGAAAAQRIRSHSA
jgi:two-component system chemotaxis response regulator CheY